MTQLSLGKQFSLSHSLTRSPVHMHAPCSNARTRTYTIPLQHAHYCTNALNNSHTIMSNVEWVCLRIRECLHQSKEECARKSACVCVRQRERERGDKARLKFRHIFQFNDSNYLYQWMIENEEISAEDPVLRNPQKTWMKNLSKRQLETFFFNCQLTLNENSLQPIL